MLRILDITGPDINNGIGIRVTLWVAGCTHHCKGCHNQWTWDFNQGKGINELGDKFEELLKNWLDREYVDGLTLSGGDPLCQDEEGLKQIKKIIDWVRENYPTKTIWMYTGYVYENLEGLKKEIADSIDVLVDGPFVQEKRTFDCPFRGSSNQRILKIK